MSLKIKTSSFFVLITWGLSLFLGAAAGEWHPAESSPPKQEQGNNSDRITRDLDLTKEQQEKLQAIYRERDRKLKSIYEDFRSKRVAVRTETDKKVDAILTPEQREKRQEQQKKRLVQRAKTLTEKGLKKN